MPSYTIVQQWVRVCSAAIICNLQDDENSQKSDNGLPSAKQRWSRTSPHSLAQMLSLVISEQQDDWDEWLPYVVQAYNNSVSAVAGLAPNEIHLGRMSRLPMTIIDECVVKGHMGKKQDQLLYLDIVRERQQRAFELVQESHLIAMSKIQRSNTKLLAILHKLPNFKVGNWVWIYNLLAFEIKVHS